MKIDPLVVLGDDVQARRGQQVVDVGDPSGDRVLDRDHGQRGRALARRGKGGFEGVARQGRHLGTDVAAGKVRVSARHALEGNGLLRIGHRPHLLGREVGVRGGGGPSESQHAPRPFQVGGSIDTLW